MYYKNLYDFIILNGFHIEGGYRDRLNVIIFDYLLIETDKEYTRFSLYYKQDCYRADNWIELEKKNN